jgi:hypothetical protein
MFGPDTEDVATRGPVDPLAARVSEEDSPVIGKAAPTGDVTSVSSAVPAGLLRVPALATPYSPTSSDPGAVVVTVGAVTDFEFAVI